MRVMVAYILGFSFIGLLVAGALIWPRQAGYYSLIDMIRDRFDTSYSRPFDRADLRADLVKAGFRIGDPSFIRIFKAENRLELWMAHGGVNTSYTLFRAYDICNFSGELGPKLKEGDHQSPEGFYQIAPSQMNPNSRHHLSFNLAFPNAYDQALARTGTYLMVHGGCSSVGCYAVTDEKVDEIYAIVEASHRRGQSEVSVHIFPFEMNEESMSLHEDHRWLGFWENLKTGYDLFEQDKIPPKVGVCDAAYVFGEDSAQEGCERVSGWG